MNSRNRRSENIVYLSLWLIACGIYLIDKMRNRTLISESLFDWWLLGQMTLSFLPYLVLFVINNYLLIPKLLLRNKVAVYLGCAVTSIIILWIYQYFQFVEMGDFGPPAPPDDRFGPHFHHPRPILPLPLFLDFTYALLVVGCNVAIVLAFRRADDRLENERLMKVNAENRLSYLKAQINPHFYMNMLNNIHGMIEIDSGKAQKMVLDMSRLMRYMLYESAKPQISLSAEIEFLQNYIELMKVRYDRDKVLIITEFPSKEKTEGLHLPPLLFLIFIENAFKHGVSYQSKSFISLKIIIENKRLKFSCVNSLHHKPESESPYKGIGLRNIEQRLSILYGEKARLKAGPGESTYSVTLSLPIRK